MSATPGWRAIVCAALVLLLPAPALAWSETGHWLVGKLAESGLTPQSLGEVRRLLQGEQDPTLAGVAAWADALRQSDPARFRATSRWHYINARQAGCGFELARDCADGQCVVAALEEQRRVLADAGQPLARRRDALKFIVHLVGDIHQPLHASDRNDSGGNRFQVQLNAAPSSAGRRPGDTRGASGTNLHSVWDQQVLASAGQGRERLAARLREALPSPASVTGTTAFAPMEWARESCAMLDAIYPAEHVLDHRYLDAQRPVAEQRIVLASVRLAALLNATLELRR